MLLFQSRLIERFMSHRLSAGYLAQFFFFAEQFLAAMHAFIIATGSSNELKLISHTHKHAQKHFSAAYLKKKKIFINGSELFVAR